MNGWVAIMANFAVFLLKVLCIIICSPQSTVRGLESSWGYREFKVNCQPGLRMAGDTWLGVFHRVSSKSACLQRCFARPECQSVSYSPKTKECLLKDGSLQGPVQDEDYWYCGPDFNEVWDRTAITIELPTTTPDPTTQEPNECDSNPCQHGECSDGLEMFTCTCSPGYSGTICDVNINECASSPCINGVCSDGDNGYTCSCHAGYEGTRCETNSNECSSAPCQNGGTCMDGVNLFTCTCLSGSRGSLCETEPIRLVSGPSAYEGRVEVWYNNEWGTVCNDGWDQTDANVACRQLLYPYAATFWASPHHGEGTGAILLDNMDCVGTETSLGACPHLGWGSHNCGHHEDSSVRCYQSGSIRLVNGPHPNEGRVEVNHNGVWGTVCDDSWDIMDGKVACRELGYASVDTTWQQAHHGQGSGSIHLDSLGCSGSESSLGACSHNGWGIHDCGHGEDASVRCNVY